MAMLLPLTTWAQTSSPFRVTVTPPEGLDYFIYDGSDTKTNVANAISVKFVSNTSGSERTVTEGVDYEISYTTESGTAAEDVKNVGKYKVVVKGLGAYEDYTAGGADFEIKAKEVTTFVQLVLAGENSSVYSGTGVEVENLVSTENTFNFLANGDGKDEFLKCLAVDIKSAKTESEYPNVGTYEIGVKDNGDPSNNYKYNAAGGGMWVEYNITPKSVTLSVEDGTYSGEVVTVSDLHAEIGGLENNDNVTVTLSSIETVKDAKKYSLTVTPNGDKKDNYNIPETVEYTINRATITITSNTQGATWTKEYDATEPVQDFTNQFAIECEDVDDFDAETLGLTMKRKTGEDVGYYDVLPYYNNAYIEKTAFETAVDNYAISYDPVKQFEITGKILEGDDKVKIAIATPTYQGKEFDVEEGGLTVTYNGEKLTENVDYTYTANAEKAKDANTIFTVTVTFMGNYAGTATEKFTIAKADLNITLKEGAELSKTYGEKDKFTNLLGEYFAIREGDLKGNDDADKLGLTMVRSEGETVAGIAGENNGYYVRPHVKGNMIIKSKYPTALTNYDIKYDLTNAKNTFYITKRDLNYTIAAEKKYDATTSLPTEFKINSEDLVKNVELGIDDSEGNIFTTKPIITWGEDVTAAKNVGTYVVTVTEENEGVADNYNPIFTAPEEGETNYEITPRTLTITAANQSIAFGTSEETIETLLADEWFKYPGTNVDNEQNASDVTNANRQLLTNDRIAVNNMYKLELSEAAKTGASNEEGYEDGIVITWKELSETDLAILANYGGAENVVREHGTLTIGEVTKEIVLNATNVDAEESEEGAEESEADESTWSVAKTIANYNGAKVKSVTIKNLTNNFMGDGEYVTDQKITAEKWYTLVLPFDVTVAELSRKFGYAIVNIPDTDNSTPEEVHFKLTMQEVPANTLMAFKVAYDMDWAEIENGITFRGKTIVAPTENYVWAEDNVGNEFRGVYAKKTITEATEFFWSPKTGKPTRASAVVNQKGHGVDVYPLNGYIRLKDENAPATVRFFMEEANGSTTAINAVTGETIKNAAEGWYTVGGVKLNGAPTEKGVYINNGQKVVIK